MVLLYRLDSSDRGTMWSDDSKTTQVTDGTAVAVWSPKAGSISTDAVQTTPANRPTYRANYASTGYPGVEFDGSNDAMTVAHSTAWNSTSIYEIAAVVYLDTVASGATFRGIFGKVSSSAWSDGFMLSNFGGGIAFGSPLYSQMAITARTGVWLLVYGRAGTSAPVTFQMSREGASVFTPVVVTGSTTTPQTNSTAVSIGFGTGEAGRFDGAIGEVRVWSGGETAADINAALYDMARKWGLLASQAAGVLIHPGMSGGMRG